MAEDDKEKTGFHTEEGVYCFTHMSKELKNSAAMLQRMIEKVLVDQRGRNVEIYLEEIVIKIKSELDLVQDVEETLGKLKRVNMKIDPATSSFRVEEGRFLGYMVTKEGVIADLEKYPICIVRVRSEATEGSGWTNEAEEALQRIKRKLNKLQTLAIPKEGEILMLCLRHKGETISSVLLVEREGIQILVSYASRQLQGMEICYTLTEKMVQALIHTTRSLRRIFRKHKVRVVTDAPMEEILKLLKKKGD
ncbi:reverse transcriptase domain-containing protein [Tanacetum coccineum]